MKRKFGVRSSEFGAQKQSIPISKKIPASFRITKIGQLTFIFLIILTTLSGCGYELVKDKGIFGGEITTVSVPIFKNPTYEPHVSKYVSQAFTKELMGTGVFRLDRTGTDGYFEGTIKDIRTIPNTLGKTGIVTEKKIYIDLDIVLYRKNGTFIRRWTLSDSEIYRADVPNYEEYNKRAAYERLSERMARRFSAAILVNY